LEFSGGRVVPVRAFQFVMPEWAMTVGVSHTGWYANPVAESKRRAVHPDHRCGDL